MVTNDSFEIITILFEIDSGFEEIAVAIVITLAICTLWFDSLGFYSPAAKIALHAPFSLLCHKPRVLVHTNSSNR